MPSDARRTLLGAITDEARAAQRQGMERDLVLSELISAGLEIDLPIAQALIGERLRDGPTNAHSTSR